MIKPYIIISFIFVTQIISSSSSSTKSITSATDTSTLKTNQTASYLDQLTSTSDFKYGLLFGVILISLLFGFCVYKRAEMTSIEDFDEIYRTAKRSQKLRNAKGKDILVPVVQSQTSPHLQRKSQAVLPSPTSPVQKSNLIDKKEILGSKEELLKGNINRGRLQSSPVLPTKRGSETVLPAAPLNNFLKPSKNDRKGSSKSMEVGNKKERSEPNLKAHSSSKSLNSESKGRENRLHSPEVTYYNTDINPSNSKKEMAAASMDQQLDQLAFEMSKTTDTRK